MHWVTGTAVFIMVNQSSAWQYAYSLFHVLPRLLTHALSHSCIPVSKSSDNSPCRTIQWVDSSQWPWTTAVYQTCSGRSAGGALCTSAQCMSQLLWCSQYTLVCDLSCSRTQCLKQRQSKLKCKNSGARLSFMALYFQLRSVNRMSGLLYFWVRSVNRMGCWQGTFLCIFVVVVVVVVIGSTGIEPKSRRLSKMYKGPGPFVHFCSHPHGGHLGFQALLAIKVACS